MVVLAACGDTETSNASGNTAAITEPAAEAPSETGSTHTATGTIDNIEGNQVTISHEPIGTLNWPAMTMPFTISDPALLNGVQAGDRVSFVFNKADETSVITSISKQ